MMARDCRGKPVMKEKSTTNHRKDSGERKAEISVRKRSRSNPKNVIQDGSHPGNARRQLRAVTRNNSVAGTKDTQTVVIQPHEKSTTTTNTRSGALKERQKMSHKTPLSSLNQVTQNSSGAVQWNGNVKQIARANPERRALPKIIVEKSNHEQQFEEKSKSRVAERTTNNRSKIVPKSSFVKQEKKESTSKLPVLQNTRMHLRSGENDTKITSSCSSERKSSITSCKSLDKRDIKVPDDYMEIKLSSSHSLQRKSSSNKSLKIPSKESAQTLSAAKELPSEKRLRKKVTNAEQPTAKPSYGVRTVGRQSGPEAANPPEQEQEGAKNCSCLYSRTVGSNNQNSGNALVIDRTNRGRTEIGSDTELTGRVGDLGMTEESTGSPDPSLSTPDSPAEKPNSEQKVERTCQREWKRRPKKQSESQVKTQSSYSTRYKEDDILEGYPEPDLSSSFWIPLDNEDLSKVANHVLKATPKDAESFESLLKYLCHDLKSSLSRVRAIYCWIVSQRLPVIDDVKDLPSHESPLGILYLITQGIKSYSEMFCKMCRFVDIPCVVIHGLSKGVMYNVGDVMSKDRHGNSWNAVYVEETWRFVHCHWASRSARGYNSGEWVTVDCPEFRTDEIEGESRSYIVSSLINDYYFFTDPSIFINKCFPFDDRWQLLLQKLSKDEFEMRPFLQPAFYALNLKLVDETLSCVVYTNDKYVLQIKMPFKSRTRLRFSYNLYRLRNSLDEGEYDYPSLDKFTLHYCIKDTAFFEIRFPPISAGEYKLQIFCRDNQVCLPSEWICDFKIVCKKGMEISIPLPVVPRIGWGINPELAKHHITAVSHTDGLYSLDDGVIRFEFVFPGKIEPHAELLKHKSTRSEFADYVTIEKNGANVSITVEPPCSGEFALQIFCRQERSQNHVNVCNYLLKRTLFAESKAHAEVRRNLATALLRNDLSLEELSEVLESFNRLGVADNGEVETARKKIGQLQLREDLLAAIKCRSLDKLEKALQSVRACPPSCGVDLGDNVSKGEKLLVHLKRLRRLRAAVLEMDSQTIAELRSYTKPPLAVHGVMVATYILLGVKEKELQHWFGAQNLIGKTGREALKKRVESFNLRGVPPEALHRAKEILDQYDLSIVQDASAGAATFYLWAINMIKDIEEQTPS